MKTVIQLDEIGYFAGVTQADQSPLETDVYLMPRNTIDAAAPEIPVGHRAKWYGGEWLFEPDLSDIKDTAPPQTLKTQVAEQGDPELVNGEWVQSWIVRDKTPEELAADLNAFRATASLPRFNFAAKAATLGYITFEEAADWAAGNAIPAGVQGVIDALPADLKGPALLDVKASPTIRRNADLMAPLAVAFGTDDAGLDALFGWIG